MKFNPRYELIIGRPSRVNNYVIPQTLVNPLKLEQGVNGVGADGLRYSVSPDGVLLKSGDYLDYNTIPAKFYKITDLQVVADIPDSTDEGAKVTFQITNLSEEIKKFIKEDDTVCFRAEYSTIVSQEEQLPDIFIGQVQRVYSSFPNTDSVTTIECGAAQTLKRNSRISYTWPPNTTREQVIRDMMGFLSKQGLPIGGLTMPHPTNKNYSVLKSPYLSGYSVQGNTMEELGKVLAACKMKSFISKGKFHIQPFISGVHNLIVQTPSNLIFTLEASNIKGVPERVEGDTSSEESAADGKNQLSSLSVVTYWDSRIGLENTVRIGDSIPEYKGDYRITSLRRLYDHRGGKYEIQLNLSGINNV